MNRLVNNPINRWVSQQHRLLPAYLVFVGLLEAFLITKPF